MMINSIFIRNRLHSFSCLNREITRVKCALKQVRHRSAKTINETTINEQEINKFRLISKNWWTDKLFEGLIGMNELRVPFITKTYEFANSGSGTSKPLKGIKLLDIGCGAGFLSEPLARLGADMTSIDPIDTNISSAMAHMNEENNELENKIDYKCATIEQLSETEHYIDYFDGVIASEVIEHVENVDLFIKCSLKCLKKGGHIFVTTINQTVFAYFGAILIAENVLKVVPKGTHQYNMFVTPKALTLLLEENGCSVSLIHGMRYKPLYRRWFWTKNQSINYALRAIKK